MYICIYVYTCMYIFMHVYIYVCILISSSNAATAICIAMYYLYIYIFVYIWLYVHSHICFHCPGLPPNMFSKEISNFCQARNIKLAGRTWALTWTQVLKLYRKAPLVGFPGQLIRGRPEEQNKWSETSAFKYPTAGNCGGPKLGNLWVFCVQVPLKMLKMLKYWGWKPTPDIGIAINFSVSLGWIFRVNQTSDVFYLIPSITLLKDLAMTAIVTSGPKSKLQ